MASLQGSKAFHITRIGRSRRHMAVLTCSKCGAKDRIEINKIDLPTQAIAQKFRARNWQVDSEGRKAICPDHGAPKKTNDTAAPTTAGGQALIAAFKLIGEHYLPDDQRYATGYSDDVIATKTGLSEKVIADLREQEFGPLKTDREVLDLQRDLTTLAQNLNKEAESLKEMVDLFVKEGQQKIAEMRMRLDGLIKSRKGRLRHGA